MDINNLNANYPKLLAHMDSAGYSQRYISSVEREIRKIIANPNKWKSYQDIYMAYDEASAQYKNREMRVILGLIMQFDLNGKYPDGKPTRLVLRRTVDWQLIPEFKRLIDYYLEIELNRSRIREVTAKRNAQCTAEFFVAMQDRGILKLDAITEEDIISFYISEDGARIRTSTYSYCIRDVLRICEPICGEVCKRLISFIPVMRTPRKNICYLTPPEAKKIRDTLNDKTGKLSLRDRAIGMLVYYTGLRGGDVVNLGLNSIDWDKDTISVVQQKTGETLELPLTAIVGNAIYDYIKNQRPDIDSNALFLTQDRNPRKISRMGHCNIAATILKAAGIRQNRGNRRGFHIFRHHFTVTMLAHNIPQPIISATLGHLDPDSIEHYAHADIVNLRKCALSIAPFSRDRRAF